MPTLQNRQATKKEKRWGIRESGLGPLGNFEIGDDHWCILVILGLLFSTFSMCIFSVAETVNYFCQSLGRADKNCPNPP